MTKRRVRPAVRARAPAIGADEAVRMQKFNDGARPQVRKVGEEKFDIEKKKVFLDMLRRTANVTRSAKAAGIAPNTAYRHRARYAQFDLAWLDAQADAIDMLETTMVERALRYNVALSEAGRDDVDTGGEAEPFSNGDAMRLIKLHRETIATRRIEVAARIRQSPTASYEQLSDKLERIYQRILAREQAANDAPI